MRVEKERDELRVERDQIIEISNKLRHDLSASNERYA